MLAKGEIPLRVVIFRCVDARLCAVKENEVDARGKVRNRIPRGIDEMKKQFCICMIQVFLYKIALIVI